MIIRPTSLSTIDVPFRVYKTHDAKADYVAYKELLIDKIDTKRIEADKQNEIRTIEKTERVNLDRQPNVIFDVTDIPLLSATQTVLPLQRVQVQNYVRTSKIRTGHFIDMDV